MYSKIRSTLLVAIVPFLLTVGCTTPHEPAEMVILGGRIVTVDPALPEVEALAIAGGRIVARGSTQEMRQRIGETTEVMDLEGGLVIPGFIESHAHFLSLGRSKLWLDLSQANSWQEIVDLVAEAASQAAPDAWILGRGWHQEKWQSAPVPSVSGLPTHVALSAVTPDHPVLLSHASGHAVFVNARAMELAAISAATADPPGGQIVRDDAGAPTGVLREAAEELVGQVRESGLDDATARRVVELASDECLRNGITSFHDAGASFDEVEILARLASQGSLGLRLWVMLSENNDELRSRLGAWTPPPTGLVTVGGIKRYMDGALGSHGAWLLEPYDDMPSTTGLRQIATDELAESGRIALTHGLQLCVHAIGDRANRETLDVFERVLSEQVVAQDRRWRIEHAQHLDAADIPRFAELGVIAAMQPVHCTSDGPWVPRRLGERRSSQGSYAWRDLMESGAVVCSGTDAPVERVDPIASFYAAVTRIMADGRRFYPEQCLSRLEALRAATLNGAFAAFEEQEKGSLEVGKLADITVLSKDILKVPEDEILDTEVLYTIVGGVVRYHRVAGE